MLIEFLIVAVILYAIDRFLPMQPAFQFVFRIFCAVVALYYLCAILGVPLGGLPGRGLLSR